MAAPNVTLAGSPYEADPDGRTLRPVYGGGNRKPKVISQPALFKGIGYAPHPGQDEILRDSTRNQVVAAGRRFGKSDLGGHRLVTEAFRAYYCRKALEEADKRHEYWIVGPEYSDSEKEFRVAYDVLKRLQVPFDKPGTYNDPIGMNMHISLWGGRYQLHAKSAKHPDTLVGEGLSGVVLGEAAKLKERVWTKFIRPTLADFNGWALMTSTPEGKNWFYERWQRGQNARFPEWRSWRRPSWSNPYVYRSPTVYGDVLRAQKLMRAGEQIKRGLTDEQYDELMRSFAIDAEIMSLLVDLPEPAFNQEIGALFTDFVGRVFKEFDEELHVTPLQFDPTWTTYAAVDYGFTNPNVWLLIQEGPWGQLHVLDEVYESGLTPDDFAELIILRGLNPSGLRTFFPDPASPGDTRVLERKLKVRATGGTGGELKHRIDAIRKALRETPTHVPRGHVDRRPTLLIDPRCTNLIRDMNEYRYPERRTNVDTNTPEAPMKKDDHGPEALGRFFAGHYGTPQRDARRARSRASSMAG